MGIFDLFKSKSERAREKKRKQRKTIRQIESAVNKIQGKVNEFKAIREKAWTEARQLLQSGQKQSALGALRQVRSQEMYLNKVEKKRWILQRISFQLQMAETDSVIVSALGMAHDVIDIDPEQFEKEFDKMNDMLDKLDEINDITDDQYGREMADAENTFDSEVPTVDQMMKDLEDEAVANISGRAITEPGTAESSDIEQAIGDAKERLNDILEGDK